jgi:nucleoside-diphosphate-sugar epimerase
VIKTVQYSPNCPSNLKEFFNMYLVTGATGLIGSHMVGKLLKENQKVRGVYRKSSSTSWFYKIMTSMGITNDMLSQQFEWVEVPLEDVNGLCDAFEGVSVVIHCAALVSFRPSDKETLYKVNVEGTAHVVNACLSAGVSTLMYVSSIAALSRTKDGEVLDEQSEWVNSDRNSNYAITKYKGEMEVWRGMEEGLKVVVVNPGFVFGFGNPHQSSTALFKKVKKGMLFFTRGENGFVDVLDVVDAMFLLLEKNIYGERFILVGHNCSYERVFKGIAHALQASPPRFCITKKMAKILIAVLTILHGLRLRPTLITRETLTSAVGVYHYSSEKLKSQTGFLFRPLEDTFNRIGQDYVKFGLEE